jgi:hypothetical protein
MFSRLGLDEYFSVDKMRAGELSTQKVTDFSAYVNKPGGQKEKKVILFHVLSRDFGQTAQISLMPNSYTDTFDYNQINHTLQSFQKGEYFSTADIETLLRIEKDNLLSLPNLSKIAEAEVGHLIAMQVFLGENIRVGEWAEYLGYGLTWEQVLVFGQSGVPVDEIEDQRKLPLEWVRQLNRANRYWD